MAKIKAKKTKSVSSVTVDRMAQEITRLAVRLDDAHRYIDAQQTKLERIEGEVEVKFATIEQVAALFVTLRRVLSTASAELANSASYTQKEIAKMSADEYREKVLVPLHMGQRV